MEKTKKEELQRLVSLRSRITDLASEFGAVIPSGEFTAAEIQGYLLNYKETPELAVKGATEWVQMTREKKLASEREVRRRKRTRKRTRIKIRCMRACVERYDDTGFTISSLNNIIGLHICAGQILLPRRLVKTLCTLCIHLLFQMSPFDTGLLFRDLENTTMICSRQFQKY